MSTLQMIIWFGSFISIYLAVNTYLFLRLRQALFRHPGVKRWASLLFVACSLSYWASRSIEKISVCFMSDILFIAGSFWFGAMLYFFMAALLVDLVMAANRIFPCLSMERRDALKPLALLAVLVMTSAAMAAGYVLAKNPIIRNIPLTVDKKGGPGGKIVMALVTDIHMGTIVKNAHLERMTEMIGEIDPDLVLLGGDMVDEDLEPVIRNDLGDILMKITGRYATYAVTGNHEYYGGITGAVRYLEEHGIIMLRDRVVNIRGIFFLAGRDDRTRNDFETEKRKSLKEITGGLNRELPLVVMDHNPSGLREAAAEGAALVLSGHTHWGQIWPMNLVTSLIYPVHGGYGMLDGTQIYVSSGFGTWGPPVRLGSRPEVVQLTITFQ